MEADREKQLAELMNTYGNSVFRMCYVYLKDYQLAEDITQETFFRVYLHYDAFRQEASVKTWILRIAINLCRNQMRTRWWKMRLQNELTDIPTEEDYDTVLDRQLVQKEIAKLSPKYREVILLYYYQELSIAQISLVLGKKEGAVKTRLARAREKLKEGLQGYEL